MANETEMRALIDDADAVKGELECTKDLLVELKKGLSADLTTAYAKDFLSAAAVFSEADAQLYHGLRNDLKGRGVAVSDWERRVKELVRKRAAEKSAAEKAAAKAATGKSAGPAQWAARKPAAQPVSGARLIAEIEAAILKYVAMDKRDALVVALWILFTHVFEGAETNPFLRVISPTWNCGKTTLLKIVFRLSRSGWLVARATQAAYYRKLQVSKHTMLLDEGDAFLAENEIWRNILDGASDPDTANISVAVKIGDNWVEDTINVFAPIAIASIGRLRRMHTVESRSIAAHLQRATKEERKGLTKWRQRAAKADLAPLAERCARWGADNLDAFTKARPLMPEHMDGRESDKFEPLFAIAALCSPDSLERITSFVISQTEDASDEYSAMILPDIKQVFEGEDLDRILQKVLCAKLAEMEGQPWGEYGKNRKAITSFQLGPLLKPYNIVSHSIEVSDGETKKRGLGYYKSDFDDAFFRYSTISDSSTREPVKTIRPVGETGDLLAVNKDILHGNENGPNPNAEKDLHEVSSSNGQNGVTPEKEGIEDAEIDRLTAADADGKEDS